MASNAGNFGVMAPTAIEPFQIENTLAKIVGENNVGNAANLLSQYHVQQQTSEGNYNYNLQQQHEFARQQLASQIAENHVKNLLEANKNPGGMTLLQQSGNAYDIDPRTVTNLEQNLRDKQVADEMQSSGAAAASFTAAGAQPTQAGFDRMSHGMTGPVTDPTAVTVAKLRLQGDLARAAARAGEKGPGESTQYRDKFGTLRTVSFPKTWTEDQKDKYIVDRGGVIVDQPLPNTPPPTADAPTGAGPARLTGVPPANAAPPPATPKIPTNVPPARTTAPANTQAGAASARQQVLANMDRLTQLHPEVAADIKQRMAENNGVPDVRPDGKGGWKVRGKKGEY